MDNKMKDSDIIKTLECCIKSTSRSDCEELECPACEKQGCYFNNISEEDYPESLIEGISISLLDLINRQMAEIERVKEEKDNLIKTYKECMTEAIKEFAERLKEIYKNHLVCSFNVLNNEIDTLVKEMVGE